MVLIESSLFKEQLQEAGSKNIQNLKKRIESCGILSEQEEQQKNRG